jgi:hypothetical protein
LHDFVDDARFGIEVARELGGSLSLSIVQYFADDDPRFRGIGLDAGVVALLAELGASVDIDQYVLVESDS